MIQVNTINGKFNISESLFEEIMKNNPELLEDDNATRRSNEQLIMNDYRIHPETASEWSKEYIDKLYKEGGLTKKGYQNLRRQLGRLNQYRHNLNDDEKQKDFVGFSKSIDSQNPQDIDSQNPQDIFGQIRGMNNNAELHNQIKEAERLAANIVKRVKILIQKYVGIGGTNVSATPSFNTYSGNTANNPANTNVEPPRPNNDNQNVDANVMKTENGEQVTEEVAEDISNSSPSTQTTSSINYYQPSSKSGRKIKSGIQLALGGFAITPLFGTRDQAGKAIKYYKSSIRKTKKSLIDDMIDNLFQLKFHTKGKIPSDYQEDVKKFENMAYSFLHNVVYKLEVNNDKHYENVLRVIRGDPALKDLFDINYVYTKQQMDTNENVISYRNKNDQIVDLLLVSRPVFYQGKKIMQNIGNILTQGRNLTA